MEDYKEKYENALAKIKQIFDKGSKFVIRREVFESIFPELKESEDEKIRKEIINYFECQSRDEPERKGIHNRWIAWLEKQGEQKPAWSDEDELVVLSIEQVIQCASFLNLVPEKLDKIDKWLKSLKQRIGWKPSKEQMDALIYVVQHYTPDVSDNLGWGSIKTLELMYYEIKKIK